MVMADGPRHLQRGPVRVGFYDIEGTLGKGNFAVVKLGRHRITKTEVRPRGSAGAWRGCAPGGGRRPWHRGDRGVQVECVCGVSSESHTGFRPEFPTREPGLWPRLPSTSSASSQLSAGGGVGGEVSVLPGRAGTNVAGRRKGPAAPGLGGRGARPGSSVLLYPARRGCRGPDQCVLAAVHLLWARRVSDTVLWLA